eukprot:4607416-Pleurochrysis_carterae.AAC.1
MDAIESDHETALRNCTAANPSAAFQDGLLVLLLELLSLKACAHVVLYPLPSSRGTDCCNLSGTGSSSL